MEGEKNRRITEIRGRDKQGKKLKWIWFCFSFSAAIRLSEESLANLPPLDRWRGKMGVEAGHKGNSSGKDAYLLFCLGSNDRTDATLGHFQQKGSYTARGLYCCCCKRNERNAAWLLLSCAPLLFIPPPLFPPIPPNPFYAVVYI